MLKVSVLGLRVRVLGNGLRLWVYYMVIVMILQMVRFRFRRGIRNKDLGNWLS